MAHAQGYIILENYTKVNNVPVYSGVTYGTSAGAKAGQFVGVNSGFKADLLFSLDGGNTFTLATGSAGSTADFWPGSSDGGTPTTDGAGVFVGPTVQIPGYTSGSVTFEVRAYNGATFGAVGTYSGTSAPFVISGLQTDNKAIPGDILNLNGATIQGVQPFVVNIPEPSIFALAGLGAAGLMAFRRKK
jgi:hypothetical protein